MGHAGHNPAQYQDAMDNSLKDKVLESTDIVAVIDERVGLTRKGKEFVGLCPFHDDHKPSMAVSPTKRIFKCWACGAGGDVIRFIQLYERTDFRTALHSLARRAGLDVKSTPAQRQADRLREEIRAATKWAAEHFRRNLTNGSAGNQAREYAHRRGLSDETIDRFSIGLAIDAWDDLLSAARRTGLREEVLELAGLITKNDKGRVYDRFRNRLIFPINDSMGRTIAFGGRTLGDDPAKYLNSPETALFSKSRTLYGFDQARRAIGQHDAAIVVEGYMDAVLLAQFGFENVVATLGTALTDAHVDLLAPNAGTFYFCFDSDQAGVTAADRAVEVSLRTRRRVRVVLLETGQDPADCVLAGGAEAFSTRLKAASDALEFKWSQALTAFDGQSGRPREAALDSFIQFIADAATKGGIDPVQQDLLAGRLSETLRVPPETIFEMLRRAKRPNRASTRAAANPSDAVASNYDLSVRGLPRGFVAAAETVLGLLVSSPNAWQMVDDVIAESAGYSQTWDKLYRVLLDVHEDMGEYSIGDIMERCEDSAVCELVGRSRERIAGNTPWADTFAAAYARLSSELGVLRMSNLVRDLHGDAPNQDKNEEAFTTLRALAREQHSALPASRRWASSN